MSHRLLVTVAVLAVTTSMAVLALASASADLATSVVVPGAHGTIVSVLDQQTARASAEAPMMASAEALMTASAEAPMTARPTVVLDQQNDQTADMARHNIGDAQPRRRPLYHDIHAMKTRALIELERQREAVASNTALAEDTRRRRLTSLDLRSRQLDSLDATLDLSLTLIRQILALMRRPLLGADDTLAELDQMREQNAAILSLIQNAAVRAQRDNKQLSDMSVDLESRERNGDATDSTESTNGDPSNTPTHSLAEELLDDVFDSLSGTVAQFERDIADDSGHPFEEAQRSGHLETVVKLNGGDAMDDPRPSSGSDHAKNNLGPESTEASTLVDADNNHYVLTRTKDPTQHIEDTRLFHDVINIVSLSFLVGTTFELMGLPPFFGHIFAGIILGPSGLNWLQNIVQVETLAQFGVLLLLFALGMEFSLESVRAHWRTTVLGGVATVTMVIVTCTAVMGVLLGMSAKQSAFFGAAVSLSSTTVVAKCLRVEDKDAHHGRVMMGTLVVQDVLLGLFLALVPALANPQPALIVRSIVAITGKSVVFLGFSWLFARMIVKPFARCFRRTLSGDSIAAIAVCFLFVRLAEYMGISTEVASFVAGIVLNSCLVGGDVLLIDKVFAARDFFGSIFFASIGIHVYPAFLARQAITVLVSTAALMGLKTACAFTVLSGGLKEDSWTSAVVSVGLSQISEFSFVFASRGKAMRVLTGEAYFLLVGVIIVSLALTPVLMRLVSSRIYYKSSSALLLN